MVNSLSALFSLSVQDQNDSVTNSIGRLYYFDYNLFMEVQSPVHQIMIFSGSKLTIYYPEEKKAFIITSKIPQMLPLFSLFIMTFESDLGLSKLGFTLKKIEKTGKTKTMYFQPMKKLRKFLKYYKISLNIQKNPSIIEVIDAKNNTISKTLIKNYKKEKSIYIPLYIETKKFIPQKNNEIMTLSSVMINGIIPNNIKNFRIPQETVIKEVEW